VSLLSRERLVVSLAPERLNAVRLSGGWRPRLLDQQAVVLQASTPLWTAGLEAMELLLDDPAWSNLDLTLILSGHYVRYAVLPKGEHLGASEQADLARLIFRNIYGELARDWELRVSPNNRQPMLACGLPKALLAALSAACEGRATLQSIQPGLMTVFNRARPLIGRQRGTLAVVENGRITLADIDAGQWQTVSSRAWAAAALPELLAETQQLSGQENGGRLWLCDLTGQAVAPDSPAWRLERLVAGAAGAASLAGWGTA